MTPEEREQVADAFGVSSALVPLLPELLTGIDVLGSWPEAIVGLLRDTAGLGPRARVLDLGCGKGPVAVAVARELGARVDGIDLFEPFLDEARAAAGAAGVGELCRFERGDLRRAVEVRGGYDAVVLAGVGAGIFGGFAGCVAALRGCVREGGWMVVDDGFLARSGAHPEPGYEYYLPYDGTVRELTARGDDLAGESLIEPAAMEELNRACTGRIRTRVAELADAHPEHSAELTAYLRSEEAECDFLETRARAAIWLLRRSNADSANWV